MKSPLSFLGISVFARCRERAPVRLRQLPLLPQGQVWPDADFPQSLHLCPLLGVIPTRFAWPELFRV